MIESIGTYSPIAASNKAGAAAAVGGSSSVSLNSTTPAAVTSGLPSDFSALLSDMAAQAIQTIKSGEATSIAGVKGKASVQEVAEAVMASERTLQTAIAVRDKVVAAYLDLSRMAI